MDPFDRFLRRHLDDVLVTQGVITRERADEFVASAKSGGVPLATVVLESGTMTPWELARTISMHYQMPVQPLTGYRFDKTLFQGLKPAILHRYQTIPIGIFGKTRTFAVAEPPSRGLIDELTQTCGSSIFFFVAEGPHIARALSENVKVLDAKNDANWQRLFESADKEVEEDIRKTRG